MKPNTRKNELFQTSHLTILISYSVLSAMLIAESLLLSWELWALILIAAAVALSWIMHIRQSLPDNSRLWMYSIFMMCTYFFYGIHPTSMFDAALVMTAVLLLFTVTANKPLILLCQITYFIVMGYDVIAMISAGDAFDSLIISRIVLHFFIIIIAGKIARSVIDKWLSVLGNTHEEIEQLIDSTDRLNDFLANVSHEIRTPINAVMGLSRVCADKEKDDAVRTDMISVYNAGKRVADQIGDILDYSEIDRGMLARNDEDYMLASLLNDLVNEIRPDKPEHIELIIDVDPAIPAVMNTDVVKLKKILRHLIMNGLKYTREGGVYVRISSIKKDYGVNLCIEVTDTGIGMTPEETERIFERFYQANSGRTRSSSGLGLGMPVVCGFVSSLGGFLRVESTPGKGTSVHVSIPQKVVDESSCMSLTDRSKLCLGGFLHFEKFSHPSVREYYNIVVRNIVKGLGVQMHRVDNVVSLDKLLHNVRLTHLFVAEEEYEENVGLMEELAKKMTVAVVANGGFVPPGNSNVRVMEKPFYCFPVASILNEEHNGDMSENGRMRCDTVSALVVDDERMNLIVAKSIFGRYGMTVYTASSGTESIDMCRSNRYDIVFMDHMMPGMDGVEAMKHIRADSRRAGHDLPIVALTANAVSTAKEMFLSEGFDGFVSKPVDLVELERVLKRVLPASKITYDTSGGRQRNDGAADEPEQDAAAVREPAETPEHTQGSSEGGDLYDELEKAGVDTAAGLKYCMNDRDFYRSLLIQFAAESDEKRTGMEKYFAEGDLKNYAILVHALKSTSRMIGCTGLSESAKALEQAAKDGDSAYISGHHAGVIVRYDALTGLIRQVCGIASDSGGEDEEESLEFEPENDSDGVLEFAPEDGE